MTYFILPLHFNKEITCCLWADVTDQNHSLSDSYFDPLEIFLKNKN